MLSFRAVRVCTNTHRQVIQYILHILYAMCHLSKITSLKSISHLNSILGQNITQLQQSAKLGLFYLLGGWIVLKCDKMLNT